MINLLIFSKDRAAQLELLLHSLYKNCRDLFFPYIVYKASNTDFEAAYGRVFEEYSPDIFVRKEGDDLKAEFLAGLETNSYITCLGTDDSIFYRKCAAKPFQIENLFHNHADLLTFSFRLGENTVVQNYVTGELQPPLAKYTPVAYDTAFGEKVLIWRYASAWHQYNYGYPFSYDFHCYKTSVLRDICQRFETLPDLRSWEGCLCNPANVSKMGLHLGSKIACFERSSVVNVPANDVQNVTIPLGTKYPISTAELNRRFMQGERLRPALPGSINSCHMELKLV